MMKWLSNAFFEKLNSENADISLGEKTMTFSASSGAKFSDKKSDNY